MTDTDSKTTPIKPVKKNKITQDYNLIHCIYQLDLNPKRLLMMVISQVDPRHNPIEQIPFIKKIDVDLWQSTFNDSTRPYKELRQASDGLMHAFIDIRSKESGKLIHWVKSIDYHKGKGTITVTLSDEIMYLLAKDGGFISAFNTYELSNVCDLKSFASIRLYELMNQFKQAGNRSLTIKELREFLIKKGTYSVYKDFKRYVIDKAVNEINSKTNLRIVAEPYRRGRSIEGIRFTIKTVSIN